MPWTGNTTDEPARKRFSMYGDDDEDDDEASSGWKELLPLELLCLLPNQAEQVEVLNKTSRTKNPNFHDFIFEFVQPYNDDERKGYENGYVACFSKCMKHFYIKVSVHKGFASIIKTGISSNAFFVRVLILSFVASTLLAPINIPFNFLFHLY